ncbi:hypothetical protein ACFVT5_14890 [Streptomyces sp. NPDC058001]
MRVYKPLALTAAAITVVGGLVAAAPAQARPSASTTAQAARTA